MMMIIMIIIKDNYIIKSYWLKTFDDDHDDLYKHTTHAHEH